MNQILSKNELDFFEQMLEEETLLISQTSSDLRGTEAFIAELLIYRRSYELWEQCGCPASGPELDEWFEAVRTLNA